VHPTPDDIRTIILDYGMVLCRRPSLEEIDRIAQIFRVDHPTFWQLYEKNRGAYDKSDIGGKEYWDRFASDTNTHIRVPRTAPICVHKPRIHWTSVSNEQC